MNEESWQPIETAPKDGTMVLTGTAGKGFTSKAYFAEDDGEWITDDGDYFDPTHWMPLPLPPNA